MFKIELWKDSISCPRLQISNRGNCRWNPMITLHPNAKPIKTPILGGRGYLHIDYERSSYMVHNLVAEVFLYKDSPDLVVNHINNDKTNNDLTNLEYVTVPTNTVKRHLTKPFKVLSIQDVQEIKQLVQKYSKRGSNKKIAKLYNTTASNVQRIRHNIIWRHVEATKEPLKITLTDELSDNRYEILSLHKQGLSYPKIKKRLELACSKDTIRRYINTQNHIKKPLL